MRSHQACNSVHQMPLVQPKGSVQICGDKGRESTSLQGRWNSARPCDVGSATSTPTCKDDATVFLARQGRSCHATPAPIMRGQHSPISLTGNARLHHAPHTHAHTHTCKHVCTHTQHKNTSARTHAIMHTHTPSPTSPTHTQTYTSHTHAHSLTPPTHTHTARTALHPHTRALALTHAPHTHTHTAGTALHPHTPHTHTHTHTQTHTHTHTARTALQPHTHRNPPLLLGGLQVRDNMKWSEESARC